MDPRSTALPSRPWRPSPRTLSRLALTALLASLVCCRPQPKPPRLEPQFLWHGDPGFEVLVEGRAVAPPPSLAGNRFLAGWRGWRTGPKRAGAATARADAEPGNDDADDSRPPDGPPRGSGIIYAPFRERARIEVVDLGGGESRDLILDLAGEAVPSGTVHAAAADRDLGGFPLTDPLRIPLPADLPLGRVAVDLALPNGVAVAQAGLSSALPAGAARRDGDDLVQSGDSLVELFAHAGGRTSIAGGEPTADGAHLVGEFIPPERPGEGARFELMIDGARGQEIAHFTWTPPGLGAVGLDMSLPPGPVRVRLLARGAGEPGRWRRLHLEGGAAQAAPATPSPAVVDARRPPALVVVFVFDALRADHVGHLGAGAGRTPTLDRLAAEGLTFAAHRSVAPNTLPSTKSLFTGRVWRAGGGLSLPRDVPTLAELVRAAGYRTACVSGNQNVSSTFAMTRGFDFDAAEVKFPPPRAAHAVFNDNAARARAAAAAWIRALDPGERGFLYVHVIHPHNPYDPPAALAERFTRGVHSRIDGATDTLRAIDLGSRTATAADRERLRGLYTASLAYADAELAGLVEAATAGRAPGDVLFAITADHGEELFDHGGLLHGYTLYEEMLRIPLVLWSPGRVPQGRVTHPTDTLDLFATVLATTGASAPPDVSGRALLSGPPADAEIWGGPRFAAASAVRGGIYGVRWGKWKVILAPRSGLQWGMGSGIGRVRDPELVFDLDADPGETTNLAGTTAVEVGWLRAELLRWIAAGAPERADASAEPVLDPEERSRLKALGYIGN